MIFCTPILVISLLLTADLAGAQAPLSPEESAAARQLFAGINNNSKGPFGLNALQGPRSRTTVRSGRMPAGGVVFQAAFRTPAAASLAHDYGLYTGNLFSTNLYALIGEFVFSDRTRNHAMPVEKLYEVGAQAFSTARLMTANWVMEKYYVDVFPETGLSRGFDVRGIGGSEFEERYAREFLSYSLNFMQLESDFLPIYLLSKNSPLVKSSSLDKARKKIGLSYSYFENYYKNRSGGRTKIDYLRKIRNNIHNQLTPAVIPMLDHYLDVIHPTYRRDFGPSKKVFLLTVRSLLVNYFKVSFSGIKKQVAALPDQQELLMTLDRLIREPDNPDAMLELSAGIAALREHAAALSVDPRQKYRILSIIKMGSHALGVWPKKEHAGRDIRMLPALLNVLYAEGLLTRAEWSEAIASLSTAESFAAALATLNEHDLLGSMLANIDAAFGNVIASWTEVQPDETARRKMAHFRDDTIKSSAGASALFYLMDSYLEETEASSVVKPAPISLQSGGTYLEKIKVLNTGSACGKLAFMTDEAMRQKRDANLSRNQIAVFERMPIDLTTVAGTITLARQPGLGHIQIKSKNRGTPNLDLGALAKGGWDNPFLEDFDDADCVYMQLGANPARVVLEHIDPAAMDATQWSREVISLCRRNCLGESLDDGVSLEQREPIKLVANLDSSRLFTTGELGWKNYPQVGSKAANYAELAQLLNTPEHTVVRNGMALPFSFYQEFVDNNPAIKNRITSILKDPGMKAIEAGRYRGEQLQALRALFVAEDNWMNEKLLNSMIEAFDGFVDPSGNRRRMKLRSSTNAEDLPRFNGAGLYTSKAYKPYRKNGKERTREGKIRNLRKALATVWASVWTQRAFDERAYFNIPHEAVYMGIQINPAFPDEDVDGVVVTRDIFAVNAGPALSIEAQRGNSYSVANPEDGALAEQILVTYDAEEPLDRRAYKIRMMRRSNLSENGESVLPEAAIKALKSPLPNVMTDDELRDLAYYSLKALHHFRRIHQGDENFALDLEFKVDSQHSGRRALYLKQVRPLIEPSSD